MKKMLPVLAAALVVGAPVVLSNLAVAEDHGHAAVEAAADATAGAVEAAVDAVVAPVEFTLADGTKGVIEGDKVFVMSGEEKVAAPDGEHTLADGSKVTTKDGMLVKPEGEAAAH